MSTHLEKSKYNSRERGFTLIETMVSLVILTIAIIPALSLSTSAVNIGYDIRDDLVAAGLAQEGIEVIRAIRDTNWFNNQPFDTGLTDGNYRVEWNSTSLLALSSNPPLKLTDGLYTYSSGTSTKFTRTIVITKINAGELKVVSQVSWPTRTNIAKTTQAEEHLFNWR